MKIAVKIFVAESLGSGICICMKIDLTKKLVGYTKRPDIGREFITFDVTGWDEVKKLTKKVLTFDGRDFIFSAWNSDRNEIYFYRPLNQELKIATIK